MGGMGSVYRARDLHFPNVTKLVAVKEMINTAPDPLVRQTIVQNFEREANLLATLNHPSIPRIYDYFTEEDRSYLVLEFIHGKDLEAIINDTNGFLAEEQVLGWAIELCDVLSFLHAHKPDPIIFRDMKPSNIMINSAGSVILVGGVAEGRLVGGNLSIVASLMGTPFEVDARDAILFLGKSFTYAKLSDLIDRVATALNRFGSISGLPRTAGTACAPRASAPTSIFPGSAPASTQCLWLWMPPRNSIGGSHSCWKWWVCRDAAKKKWRVIRGA